MATGASYIFMVSMDVAADKEDLFNEVYDQEHVPNLLRVPGVLAARRGPTAPVEITKGGGG